MPFDAKFFEEYPLYRKFACQVPDCAEKLADEKEYPAIVMDCPKCRSKQTFRVAERFRDGETMRLQQREHEEAEIDLGQRRHPKPEQTLEAIRQAREPFKAKSNGCMIVVNYLCAACSRFFYKIAYRVSEDAKAIQKIGQYPPWSIEPTESMKRALADHLRTYKNGLICESQGYGIGAFAYYRRIVEVVISDLLKGIEELIRENDDRAKYHAALANIQESQSAASRIEVVKDLLPASLRPDGRNPLDILYQGLSVGLHEETDETCLGWAEAIRATLTYLIEEVAIRRKTAREYEKSMDDILARLQKVGQVKTDVK